MRLPSRRLVERFGVSSAEPAGSSGRAGPPSVSRHPSADDELRRFLRAFSVERPRWNWHRAPGRVTSPRSVPAGLRRAVIIARKEGGGPIPPYSSPLE